MATAAPSRSPLSAARQRTPLAVSAQASLAADTQLVSALRAHIAAARQRERATLAAIDQRLRAIYAVPGEPPLVALLTGNAAQAQALVELASAMTESDDALLSSYTAALTNLQIAQSQLAQNVLRIDARMRIAGAQRATARLRADGKHRAVVPTASATVPPTPSDATGGLPTTIITQHALPGSPPVNPVTGHAIVVPA